MKLTANLLRIKQWIKNIFIFLPAFFGGVFLETDLGNLLIGFLAFCLIASSIYIINDIKDVEEDRKHPEKRNRPIAAKEVSPRNAFVLSVLLFIAAALLSFFFLPVTAWYILATYFILNLFYSTYLKHISIVDLIIVSSGFVFRIILGAIISAVTLSYWLLLMTFLFSLFIVIAKRRDDFTTTESTPYMLRKVNKYYNLNFLNTSITIVATLMMVCYVMYTFNSPYFENKNYMALLSSVLVIVGLLRYFQAIFVEEKGGAPTEFALQDTFIKIVVLLWVLIFTILIYF